MRIQTTQPVRNLDDIQKIKSLLPNKRDRIMFLLGINSALRISDIVNRRVDEFNGTSIEVRERKTGKIKAFKLSQSVKEELMDYINELPPDEEYVFPSQKGGHIGRVQAYRIIKHVANLMGLEHVSPHSMRKTFGYQAWKKGVSLAYIMEAFNHSSIAVTKRYLGITQDELNDELYSKMAL